MQTTKIISTKPSAIVLGLNIIGLACVRFLAKGGVKVYGVSLYKYEEGQTTLKCQVVKYWSHNNDYDKIEEWLENFIKSLPDRPVVFPTNDNLALMIARRYDRLKEIARIWTNSFDSLEGIISKNRIYDNAKKAGIPIPPTIISSKLDDIISWTKKNPGPYLVKPYYYQGVTEFDGKNKTFKNIRELTSFLKTRSIGADGLIIQRILKGGDGLIYDCYGLCDKNGQVRTLASHRRIRQHLPHFGVTCYGEIPSVPPDIEEQELFDLTRRLIAKTRYHGIFGIEWLYERETSKLYFLDFNARPFLTIGHLGDCGLSLPLEAYRELCDDELNRLSMYPKLQKKIWVNWQTHFRSFQMENDMNGRDWIEYFGELLGSRSFALWDLTDPLPALFQIILILKRKYNKIFSGF